MICRKAFHISVVIVLTLNAGCAGLQHSEADTLEEFQMMMNDWRVATLKGDVDSYGSIFADDYSDLNGATKDTYVNLMETAIRFDLMKYIEIDLSQTATYVQDDKLLYGPLTIAASGSPIPIPALEIIGVFHRIDGQWKMVTTSQDLLFDE